MFNFKILFVTLAAAIIAVSCSDDSTTSPATGNGTMSAKIAGDAWSPSLTVQATNTSGVIAIAGQDNNTRQIQLRLLSVSAPGTYNLGIGSMHFAQVVTAASATDTYSTSMVGGSGTITLTEISATKAKGSFSFTGINTSKATKSVTDGTFDVTFK